jgi:GTPase
LSNRNRAPEKCTEGKDGEEWLVQLELKLLAEVGIIGLPNAGKSTLISVLSAARPKIADYPFTTLVPNLGVVRRPSGDGTVFADIPGLIAGAAQGAGLGHEFLRHIERTRLLLHLVDASSATVLEDVQVVERELQAYGHGLPERPRLLVLNKIELLSAQALAAVVAELNAHLASLPPGIQGVGSDEAGGGQQAEPQVLAISAATSANLGQLLGAVWQQLGIQA